MSIDRKEKIGECPKCKVELQYRVIGGEVTRGPKFDSETIIKKTKKGIRMIRLNESNEQINNFELEKMSDEEWNKYIDENHYVKAMMEVDDKIICVCPQCTYAKNFKDRCVN